MRYATVKTSHGLRPAVLIDDEILDIDAAQSLLAPDVAAPQSLLEIFQLGNEGHDLVRNLLRAVGPKAAQLRSAGVLKPYASAKLAAPLPNPGMVLSIGANYHEHLKEMNTPAPATPMCFYKSVASIVGSGDKIIPPKSNPDMLDWEGEFSVVIGTACHDVSEGEALKHVGGYTIVNDVSARDWVAPALQAQGMINTIVAWEHNILGKLYPTFCPMGPVIVTSDEIPDPHNLNLVTRLNGQVVQSTNTSDLVFNVAQIISYYSRFLTFRPGDVITTGSPSGVGYGRKPQLFMKSGDVIEVEVQNIGILRNTIA